MLLPAPRSAGDTRVLQPCQQHAETAAPLTSLLPQVPFINRGISKGLILPLARFEASLSGEVPHPRPRMLPLKLAVFVCVVQYINPHSREIKDLTGLLPSKSLTLGLSFKFKL